MGLSEVREKINYIDGKLIKLLDERAECSAGVAEAKLNSDDLIFKPERELEICDKFAESGRGMGPNVIKSVMRNSRMIQYEMYVDAGIVPEEFRKMASELPSEISLEIFTDADNTKKLCKPDILAILAESGFEIVKLVIDEDIIKAVLSTGNDKISKKRAYVLLLMLYMETAGMRIV